MSDDKFGILRFKEQYFERIWGGQRLRTLYGKPIPEDKPIGEAWLISDHPSAVSVVCEGRHAGRTLHDLIEEDAGALLGPRSKLTPHGRFPLLLKLLDSTDVLSVQVHPDDATAAALGEPDVGKTEMWYILHADPGAELICGLKSGATVESLRVAISEGDLERYLNRFNVKQGDSVLVTAGTVHAIGKGIVLAEIQQNSDITYRLYDWNRIDPKGQSRELHIEKGLRATKFDAVGELKTIDAVQQEALSGGREIVSCEYFRAQLILPRTLEPFHTKNSVCIVLAITSRAIVSNETSEVAIETGECCLIPASAEKFTINCAGIVLLYSA